jgi:NADPH:quinone reductase-like Zn-dependent oxidoreductase
MDSSSGHRKRGLRSLSPFRASIMPTSASCNADALGAKNFGSFQEVLELTTLSFPSKCEENDVLIKVSYSDVNPVDFQKLKGGKSEGQPVPSPPFVPGYGGSGVVLNVGPKAPQHLVGRNVCFIADPNRPGSYASHVLVDARSVAEIPPKVELRDAASIPVAGLTAYECLVKLGLASNIRVEEGKIEGVGLEAQSAAGFPSKNETTTVSASASMLIVGGSGGVGSWIITLARAWHPGLNIFVTASRESHEWCQSLGASKVMDHDAISNTLSGGSVNHIVCLSEPTPTLFNRLAEVIKPYGKICLVVSGSAIASLDLSFCFFKCVDILTQTVFSSIRTKYEHIVPSEELMVILSLMASQSLSAPLSPDMTGVSEKFSDALKDKGVLKMLQGSHRRGNFVLQVDAGDDLIFLDLKTSSLLQVSRPECIKRKILNRVTLGSSGNVVGETWKEQAPNQAEREALIQKVTSHRDLGIVKVVDKLDVGEIELQESEQVKSLWGVELKKREKNVKGEEFLFVDPRSGAVGELSRKQHIQSGFLNIVLNMEGKETVEDSITDFEERDNVVQLVRQALDLTLGA